MEAQVDTVLFTDHGIVVFAISAAAAALLLSVLGLATTHQIRSDIKGQFCLEGAEQQAAASEVCVPLADTPRGATPNEWASLRDEFSAVVREGAESIEDMLDEQFRRRFGELMYRTARASRESLAA
jgi:hypothetical protein